MALFGKKETSIDEILNLIGKLSDEERTVLKDKLSPTDETEHEEEEEEVKEAGEEATAEPAPEQEQAKADGGEEATAEPPTEEKPAETEQPPAEDTSKANAEAQSAEIEAFRSELAELKETVMNLANMLEGQPFGAKPAPPITDKNNGRWEGDATKAYFSRR